MGVPHQTIFPQIGVPWSSSLFASCIGVPNNTQRGTEQRPCTTPPSFLPLSPLPPPPSTSTLPPPPSTSPPPSLPPSASPLLPLPTSQFPPTPSPPSNPLPRYLVAVEGSPSTVSLLASPRHHVHHALSLVGRAEAGSLSLVSVAGLALAAGRRAPPTSHVYHGGPFVKRAELGLLTLMTLSHRGHTRPTHEADAVRR